MTKVPTLPTWGEENGYALLVWGVKCMSLRGTNNIDNGRLISLQPWMAPSLGMSNFSWDVKEFYNDSNCGKEEEDEELNSQWKENNEFDYSLHLYE
jgi:hypothetical protein